jgi:hypothetical protein
MGPTIISKSHATILRNDLEVLAKGVTANSGRKMAEGHPVAVKYVEELGD